MEYKTIAVLLLLKVSRLVCGSGTYIIKNKYHLFCVVFLLHYLCIHFFSCLVSTMYLLGIHLKT